MAVLLLWMLLAVPASRADAASAAPQWKLLHGETSQKPAGFVRAAVTVDGSRLTRIDVRARSICRRDGGKARPWSSVLDFPAIKVRNGRFSYTHRFRHPQSGDLDIRRLTGRFSADGRVLTGSFRDFSDFYGNRCDTGTRRYRAEQWLPARLTGTAATGEPVQLDLGPASGEISRPEARGTLTFGIAPALTCTRPESFDDDVPPPPFLLPLDVQGWPVEFDVSGFTREKTTTLGTIRLAAPSPVPNLMATLRVAVTQPPTGRWPIASGTLALAPEFPDLACQERSLSFDLVP